MSSNLFTWFNQMRNIIPIDYLQNGLLYFENLEIYRYELLTGKQSWADARAMCQKSGGGLSSFNNMQDYERALQDLSGAEWMWMGLSDKENEGTWLWSDGNDGQWRNWDDIHPNGRGNKNCAAIKRADKKWHSLPCTDSNFASGLCMYASGW